MNGALDEAQQRRLAQHSWKSEHWKLVNGATIEGATVLFGTTLVEGATLELGK